MLLNVFGRSSGILAITIRFLAERLYICPNSEHETNVELHKHAPNAFCSMPYLLCNTLVMYTCACTPVGPP
eukprot:13960805-Heterocapsa_arctica.AAC.1